MTRFGIAVGGAVGISVAAVSCSPLHLETTASHRKLYAELDDCGLDTGQGKIEVSSGQTLLTMKAPQALGPAQTACMARVMLDYDLDLQAPDTAFAQSYAAAWQREHDRWGARMAKVWMARNRKARVPTYAPNRETLEQYVRKLERLCDAPEGSVETTPNAVRIPWLDGEANEKVSCVYLAALASNLPSAGIRIESVGGQ